MPQTQIACPRCKQLITANVEQLFDVTSDPGAKQRLLGGVSNMARCPHCGYEGRLATPIVYHDADKELLLTYFPPELGLPINEQERLIGPMITQITNRLPSEKRKAYLFKPIANLTFESMMETILGKDGVTKVGEPPDADLHPRELFGGPVEDLLDLVGPRRAVVVPRVQAG